MNENFDEKSGPDPDESQEMKIDISERIQILVKLLLVVLCGFDFLFQPYMTFCLNGHRL